MNTTGTFQGRHLHITTLKRMIKATTLNQCGVQPSSNINERTILECSSSAGAIYHGEHEVSQLQSEPSMAL